MSNESQVREVEVVIEGLKKDVQLLGALERLENNKDFQLLIGSEYFKDEAARAVMSKSHPGQQSPEAQQSIEKVIIGIGQLQQFLMKVRTIGTKAKENLDEYQDYHARLLSGEEEELDNDY